jgi:streptomycin 6-kinase
MDIMGLHGIVMESMKMTHVYTTKIHDIFWDRMRLTAYIYIYGCISIVEHNQNHEQHQSMNIAMAISSKQNLMVFHSGNITGNIYMSYIVNLMI